MRKIVKRELYIALWALVAVALFGIFEWIHWGRFTGPGGDPEAWNGLAILWVLLFFINSFIAYAVSTFKDISRIKAKR
jgi:hypothetical protein